MAEPIKVAVKNSDFTIKEPSTTVISSVELVNALVVESADAWQSIADSFCAVNTDAVRVRADGKIVIDDAKFTRLVKQFLAAPGGAGSNTVSICANCHCQID